MNQNNEYQNYGYNSDTDFYTMYTDSKVKEARGVFSRYNLALFLYTAVAYAVIIVTELLLIAFMGIEKTSSLIDGNIYLQWLFGVGPMYLIGFPVFFMIIKGMKTLKREKTKMPISEFLILFVMCQGIMFVGNIIGQSLNSLISAFLKKEVVNGTNELIENSPVWLIILIAVIIGPVIEELLFRKFMIDRLGRYGDAVAITVSAVAFGLFHGNFYQFFYAAMLGFMLGYIYVKTGDVRYSIAMHVLLNFFGSVATMPIINAAEKLEEMSTAIQEGAAMNVPELIKSAMLVGSYTVIEYAMVITGIALAVSYFVNKKFKLTGVCEYKIPRERVAGAVILNTGTILFLLLSLVLFAVNIFLV